jgi:hypothetical protein
MSSNCLSWISISASSPVIAPVAVSMACRVRAV